MQGERSWRKCQLASGWAGSESHFAAWLGLIIPQGLTGLRSDSCLGYLKEVGRIT
jgi:hypothetical protein